MAQLANLRKRFESLAKKLDESIITKGIRSVDPFVSGVGTRLETHLKTVGPRWKYLAELLLRVPLIFICHQWALLSPTSSYWIIELVLFVVRGLGDYLIRYIVGLR